jgi:hypothetical protein
MLIAFVILILIILSGILVSMYSTFMPFLENLSDIVEYNVAYYWALSSIERWSLVTKYKWPWFEWSWWYIWDTPYGPNSDNKIWDFWRLNYPDNWMLRTIHSKTRMIPNTWAWNIEYLLAADDSYDYNKMEYDKLENFILTVDNSSEYYSSWDSSIIQYNWTIEWHLRLPPKISSWFDSSWW